MNVLNILLIASVFIFIAVSLGIFFKRYKENKAKLESLSKENAHELKKSLEEELKKKKEEELKKLESGDKETISFVFERLFKSSKLAGWVKSQTFNLHNSKSISVIVHLSGKEELVSTQKEIKLKTGEVYTQNKHYLAVKKEYSEKVFLCAYKVVEEAFTNIPTLYKMYISEYITEEESDNPMCVLSMEVNKDQYRTIKEKNLNNAIDIISYFNANFNYDNKNHIFQEVEPIKTPAGETSLEKTMATKVSSNTSFYGSTIVDPDASAVNIKNDYSNFDNSTLSSDTKISSLKGSIMLDKTMVNIPDEVQKEPDKTEFEQLTDQFLAKSKLKIIRENTLADGERSILAINPDTQKTFLINISKNEELVKEESLKTIVNLMLNENIENGIFITNGAFALDCVSFATKNNIELFDREKINKIVP